MQRVPVKYRWFAAALVGIAGSFCHAASFNCKLAKTATEKLVCDDPEVSKLDEQMASAFAIAQGRLSPKGQHLLRSGQRQWLRYVQNACAVRNGLGPDPTACLQGAYHSRLDELGVAAVRLGPYVFSRIDYFDASSSDPEGRPYLVHASAPRIDSPQTEDAQQWNAQMAVLVEGAAGSSCDAGKGDEYSGYRLVGALPSVVSIRTDFSEYCHGTAHGHGGTRGLTYVLRPQSHPLSMADLFDPFSDWLQVLTDRTLLALQARVADRDFDREQVLQFVSDERHWTLRQDGLVITIDPYVFLAYAYGPTEVFISWADLKPLLSSQAPLPREFVH